MNTVSITCYQKGCGYSPFPMEKGFYERARRTHESWHCPAGHAQHFAGESDEDRLERENKHLRRERDRWQANYERAWRDARICPWPTCREYVYSSRDSLYDHMRRAHGMPTVALVREAS